MVQLHPIYALRKSSVLTSMDMPASQCPTNPLLFVDYDAIKRRQIVRGRMLSRRAIDRAKFALRSDLCAMLIEVIPMVKRQVGCEQAWSPLTGYRQVVVSVGTNLLPILSVSWYALWECG